MARRHAGPDEQFYALLMEALAAVAHSLEMARRARDPQTLRALDEATRACAALSARARELACPPRRPPNQPS